MARPQFPAHWAALPETVADLRARPLAPRAAWWNEEEFEALLRPAITAGGIAVLHIAGPLTKRASLWGGTVGMRDYEAAIAALQTRSDVSGVLLAIDSPGGTVDGAQALAAAVAALSAVKPVVAWADGCMCSAAYWVGSQASQIVAAPLAQVGSIGTILIHADYSVMLAKEGIKVSVLTSSESPEKGEANPYEPLSEEVRAKLTTMLDRMTAAFHAGVRAGRPQLSDAALTGASWMAEDAPAGLIDSVGSYSDAIALAQLLVAQRSSASVRSTARLTQPAKSMVETIKAVRAAFSGNSFQPVALGLAADGKTEAEIWQSYAQTLEARNESTAADHAKALAAKDAAHADALKAKDAEVKAKDAEVKAERDAKEAAEAKLKSGGFTAAETRDTSGTRAKGISIRKL